jgi:glycosyltransferase involved in cell wall biosynthesis
MSDDNRELLATVIIPTWNRSELLRDLLESLRCQTQDPTTFEVIVVDDCSTDDTPQLLSRMQKDFPCPLIVHRPERNAGPVVARNVAAAMARGKILVFTDSDCRVSRHWLEHACKGFERTPRPAFVAGAVLDKPEQPIRFFSLPNGTGLQENPVYPTWNIAYDRETFLKLGGFDVQAYFGNIGTRPIDCSDSDFALMVKRLGYPYVFDREMLAHHEVWTPPPTEWLAAHFRMMYIPALLKRHSELRGKIMHCGPFLNIDGALFHLAVFGIVGAVAIFPAAATLTIPLVVRIAARVRPWTLSRLHKALAQFILLLTSQAVQSSALLYGSIRMRTVVL